MQRSENNRVESWRRDLEEIPEPQYMPSPKKRGSPLRGKVRHQNTIRIAKRDMVMLDYRTVLLDAPVLLFSHNSTVETIATFHIATVVRHGFRLNVVSRGAGAFSKITRAEASGSGVPGMSKCSAGRRGAPGGESHATLTPTLKSSTLRLKRNPPLLPLSRA